MSKISQEFIIAKVKQLLEEMAIPKMKLGEVLGSKGESTNSKIALANRFLSGRSKTISVDEINAVAEFFQKPVSYFLNQEIFQEAQPSVFEKPKSPDEILVKEIAELAENDKKTLKKIIRSFQEWG